MKKVGLCAILVWSSVASLGAAPLWDKAFLESACTRIKGVEDGVCKITDVCLRLRSDPNGEKRFDMAQIETQKEFAATGTFLRVEFTLTPEKGCNIRCRALLVHPEKWDGRFWGGGNSGYAGVLPSLDMYLSLNMTTVVTDLGTSAVKRYWDKSVSWPKFALRDFHWRSTHLMTVYGKRIVKAFYGREHKWAYFFGGSTGGRQGLSEAMRFPGDYDGIVSFLPDAAAAVNEIATWHLWRQTHDLAGKALFTKDELTVVSDAAVEYKATTDPKPYAGRLLADARFTEKEIDGFLALAAKKCPSLASGDKLARLKALYMPLMHKGKCYFSGYAPGTNHAPNFEWPGLVSMPHFLAGKGFPQKRWAEVGFNEVDLYLKEIAPEINACASDLSAFAKRGGKIIVSTGWEDQAIPPGPIVEFYERVCKAHGGLNAVTGFMRLFCVPGCAHGGGTGRALTISPPAMQFINGIIGWCEKGTPPEKLQAYWRDRSVNMPIAPYPGLYYQDDKGVWKIQNRPRGVARIDASCVKTKTHCK